MYRQRFDLTGHPFPKNARGEKLFTDYDGYRRLARLFGMLVEDPGLGILTAEPGTGKTAAIRNLAQALPEPQHRIVYLSDTQVGPVDLYRTLAWELGIEPAFRRVALWRDLKSRLLHMVDERDERPVIIIDDAHHLSERFLSDFSGFLNFAFDSRDLFTTWLVGHTELRTRLKLYRYTALRTRIVASVHLEPHTKREVFAKFLSHGLAAAGAKKTIFTDSAHELLFRASGGLARDVSKIVRRAFRIADERELSFVDDGVMEAAIGEAAEL